MLSLDFHIFYPCLVMDIFRDSSPQVIKPGTTASFHAFGRQTSHALSGAQRAAKRDVTAGR